MQKKVSVLLTICISFLLNTIVFSQENEVVIYTHGLGKFYLYINNQLIERAPQKQFTVNSTIIEHQPIRIVFQDHEIAPFETKITVRKKHKLLFVIYAKNGKVTISPFKKTHKGQYLPGFVSPSYSAVLSYTGRLGCDYPASTSMISSTIQQLAKEQNDVAQVTIALDLIKNYCLTVAQLRLIIERIPSEKSKIELTRYAWPYIYDQENYSQLTRQFKSPKTIHSILKFVQTNQ